MTKTCVALFVAIVFVGLPAWAATPVATRVVSEKSISPGEVTATPEMWFYQQQMELYQNPKMVVRRNAEFRAEMRARRMASMQWFGYSNQRPIVNSDPLHDDYSPRWTSNNTWYPDRWVGTSGQ